MGVLIYKGMPMTLSFDCSSFGIRDIECYDEDSLKKLVKAYCKHANINYNDVQEVSYNYNKIDTSKKVKELGIASGSVILIKLKSTFDK